ncbi:MAG: hypothetical protein HYT36_00110 [Candidatus Staskawiczbacteria bacterium]|nr:hypothetical protein [Candidatus Staskawiczbacteria bacterium]
MSKDKKELIQGILGVFALTLMMIGCFVYGLLAKEYMIAGLSALILGGACVLMANAGIWELWKELTEKEKEEKEKKKIIY